MRSKLPKKQINRDNKPEIMIRIAKSDKAQALKKDTSRHNQDPRYTTNKLETRLVSFFCGLP
jgi:hypothetical protein